MKLKRIQKENCDGFDIFKRIYQNQSRNKKLKKWLNAKDFLKKKNLIENMVFFFFKCFIASKGVKL